jgi:hypothetical protein
LCSQAAQRGYSSSIRGSDSGSCIEETETTDIDGDGRLVGAARPRLSAGRGSDRFQVFSKSRLNDTTASVTVGGGDISNLQSSGIGFGDRGKLTQTANGFTLTINTGTGLISGDFLDEGKKYKYGWTLFRKTNSAYSVFFGSAGSTDFLEITGSAP